MSILTFYMDGDMVAVGPKHRLTFSALNTPTRINAVANATMTCPTAVITAPSEHIELSMDGLTGWGATVSLTDIRDTGTPFYARQTTEMFYGETTYLVCSAEDLTFLPVDYTFASTYFVNADITALVA